MNEDKYSEIISFDSKIKENGEIEIPRDKLLAVLQKGYKDIKVYIFGDSKKTAIELGYDVNLFDRIKEIQSIPDSVVLGFLKAKGSLFNIKIERGIF
jgi:hypothetical protein